jgi:hypothetical protein
MRSAIRNRLWGACFVGFALGDLAWRLHVGIGHAIAIGAFAAVGLFELTTKSN